MAETQEMSLAKASARAWLANLATVLLLAGCGFEQVSGRSMGTSYRVQAKCPAAIPAPLLDAALRRVNEQMSTYDPSSELSRFNRAAVGRPMPASAALVRVVAVAHGISQSTGGAFDVTAAPLVALWGFGAEAAGQFPNADEVAKAKALVNYRNLRHRFTPPLLEKRAALQLDLSAIAKGHAVDQLAQVLQEAGCRSYLVELGGEIRVAGVSPSATKWRLSVESPAGTGQLATLALAYGAVATSGDYRQYREHDGKRLSHIVDPRSGYPVSHRLAAVTVVAETALLADAYATALMVLGADAGKRFAEQHDLAALFVTRLDDGFEISQTSAMRRYR